ncbi:MAG: transcription antitermination factor NusB [Pseudomonadota bacterium]
MKPDAGSVKGPAANRLPRSAARLAAVQALYQMELTGVGAEAVIRQFRDHRFGVEDEDGRAMEADEAFFADVVRGVVASQKEIDRRITEHLAANWKLTRIDSILRASLRAGGFELIARADVSAKTILNEYVDVAHAFFDGDEPAFMNAALDAIAKDVRGAELALASDEGGAALSPESGETAA